MFTRIARSFAVLAAVWLMALGADAQTKRKKAPVKKTTAAAPAKAEAKTEIPPVEVALKKNERPTGDTAAPTPQTATSNQKATTAKQKPDPLFTYEFTQPDFITSRIIIEHDEKGVGKISFARRGGRELFTDPIRISEASLKRLNENFDVLHFLDSTENYQHEKDFSHMGNIRISINRAGRSRLAAFNFTLNKYAKALADEYRRIANQALWIFDITTARENQPLESPNQMKHLESLIKRNEISDAEQMLPFLRNLSDDERLPLIARNNATRIIQSIEKKKN